MKKQKPSRKSSVSANGGGTRVGNTRAAVFAAPPPPSSSITISSLTNTHKKPSGKRPEEMPHPVATSTTAAIRTRCNVKQNALDQPRKPKRVPPTVNNPPVRSRHNPPLSSGRRAQDKKNRSPHTIKQGPKAEEEDHAFSTAAAKRKHRTASTTTQTTKKKKRN